MIKYAKVVNEQTKVCEVGLGTNTAFYESLGMVEMDVEKGYDWNWYLVGFAPEKPEPTVQEQIEALEAQITPRNLRNAIQGDEYALNKINSIEAEIELLRAKITMEGDTL